MTEIKHWTSFPQKDQAVIIHFPTCGGGEECITVCPHHEKIWEMKEMDVSFFGVHTTARKRPVMKNTELCSKCYLCVEACPTGSLVISKEYPIKNPAWKTTWYLIKLFFKKRYGLLFILNKKHVKAFLRNNFSIFKKLV